MDIAILSDIHGNYTALRTVLADIKHRNVDQILCLGDVAATGPQPHECVRCLGELGALCVMGNTDAWLLDPKPFVPNSSKNKDDHFMRQVHEADLWCIEQLTLADHDFMRTFQPTISVDLGDGKNLLCFHGSPRSYGETIVATTPDAELDPMFADQRAAVMCGGHTHQPYVRRYYDSLLFNPGSVGLPFERIRGTGELRNPGWAEYALLHCGDGRVGVELCRVPLDVVAVVRAIRAGGVPYAETWVADWG